MRLTPSWFRSSSEDPSREDPDVTNDGAGVTIYHTPSSEITGERSESERRAATFIPESDAELVAVLERMSTPVTVDEVADELIAPARPPVETWASVHEQLHQERLPDLDDSGEIVFDESQGIVERPRYAAAGAQSGVAVTPAVSKTAPIRPSTAFLALLSLVLLSAVVFVAMTYLV